MDVTKEQEVVLTKEQETPETLRIRDINTQDSGRHSFIAIILTFEAIYYIV